MGERRKPPHALLWTLSRILSEALYDGATAATTLFSSEEQKHEDGFKL